MPVNLRARINDALIRTTGYRIVRAGPRPSSTTSPTGAPAEPAGPEKRPVPKKMKTQLAKVPSDYDQETKEIWDAVRFRTMTRHERVEALITAVRYVERHQVPGAIVECGVWRGGSMLACAHTLLRRGSTDRDLYLFDTFTGMSEPTDKDVRIEQGKSAAELMSATRAGPAGLEPPGAVGRHPRGRQGGVRGARLPRGTRALRRGPGRGDRARARRPAPSRSSGSTPTGTSPPSTSSTTSTSDSRPAAC